MSKPHSSLRHFMASNSLSAGTTTRLLSRNSDVVTASWPMAARSLFRTASWSMSLLLQARGRLEVTGGDDLVLGGDGQRQGEDRPLGPGPRFELAAGHRAGLLDLLLDVDERLQDLLRPRRATRNVDVHRHEAIDPLHDRVSVENATRRRARPHRDAPLGLGHLQPGAL